MQQWHAWKSVPRKAQHPDPKVEPANEEAAPRDEAAAQEQHERPQDESAVQAEHGSPKEEAAEVPHGQQEEHAMAILAQATACSSMAFEPPTVVGDFVFSKGNPWHCLLPYRM